jgi:hypothetical protein
MNWKPITSNPAYSVSDTGLIRNEGTGRILKLQMNKEGYMQICLFIGGIRHTYAHALVLEAFVSKRPKDNDADHINRNPSDNNLSNLRWVSHKDNCFNRGERTQTLTPHLRQKIRLSNDFFVARDIAAIYGISRTYVHMLKREGRKLR